MPRIRVLSGSARAFARRYTELVEALQEQGVPQRVAREEARQAATVVFLMAEYREVDEPCPMCGRTA